MDCPGKGKCDTWAFPLSLVKPVFITDMTQMAEAEARRVCWDWVVFLTAQPEAIRTVPARRSVVESDAFREKVGPDRAAVYGGLA